MDGFNGRVGAEIADDFRAAFAEAAKIIGALVQRVGKRPDGMGMIGGIFDNGNSMRLSSDYMPVFATGRINRR
jgi:hypothetical protein